MLTPFDMALIETTSTPQGDGNVEMSRHITWVS